MHAALEVAVARQDGSHHQVAIGDAFRHFVRQRAGIADAGGAAVADHVETKRFQIGEHPGLAQIVGDHQRARADRSLDPRRGFQAFRHRIARQQAGAQHHRRVGGIGAGGDRGDHHRTVGKLAVVVADADLRLRLRRKMFGLRLRGALGIHARGFIAPGFARGGQTDQIRVEIRLHGFQQHTVLRAFRSGQRGLHIPQIQFKRGGVGRLGRMGVMPHALGPGIRFDQRDLRFAAARKTQVGQGFGIDRENAAGRPVFGRHVGDGGAVGQRKMLQAFAEELDEFPDDTVIAQHLGDGEHKICRGRAFRHFSGEPETHHLRNQHRRRLAKHRRFGFDAAHAPAQHAESVDHGGVRIRSEHRIRKHIRVPVDLALHHHARQMLQIHLMHDTGVRRHDLEVVERFLAPAQETVALLIALEFDLPVDIQGFGLAEHVDLHRMIDHQFRGNQRIDLFGVAAEGRDRIAHGGKIHHAGHAGKVLQHHTRRHERDFGVGLFRGIPARDRFDVRGEHAHAVFVPEQVLQKDLHGVGECAQFKPFAQLRQAVISERTAADFEAAAGVEGILHGELLGGRGARG